ncbi:MAG: c-type cytochrome [Chloroflexota bacterium]
MKEKIKYFALILLGWLMVSCHTGQPAAVDARDLDPFSPDALCDYTLGDPKAGEALFNQPALANNAGCVNCHSLKPDLVLVGPSLHNIAETAKDRIPGVIAANYIYLSIMEPNQHVMEGFEKDVMPLNYGTELTTEEITNLVSYLMTLTEEK